MVAKSRPGLEIRREIHSGELSAIKRAALPAVAALGGMVVPALLYLGFNHSKPGAGGWGVPMATDIAFAVAGLALLGKRVPAAVRVTTLPIDVHSVRRAFNTAPAASPRQTWESKKTRRATEDSNL